MWTLVDSAIVRALLFAFFVMLLHVYLFDVAINLRELAGIVGLSVSVLAMFFYRLFHVFVLDALRKNDRQHELIVSLTVAVVFTLLSPFLVVFLWKVVRGLSVGFGFAFLGQVSEYLFSEPSVILSYAISLISGKVLLIPFNRMRKAGRVG